MSDERPVVAFQLNLIGRLNPANPRSAPKNDSALEGKRKDQERVRQLAATFSEEVLLRYVHIMRTSTDNSEVMRAGDRILNRAIGLAKAVSEEERKGADAHSLLDVLAAFSGQQAQLERSTSDAPAIAHTTIDNDQSAANFFDELERSRRDEGDIVDGEVVSD